MSDKTNYIKHQMKKMWSSTKITPNKNIPAK